MDRAIETAADLYAELKRRGLHLRRNAAGRDGALLRELCKTLGCPDDNLKVFLDGAPQPAEVLLDAFMEAAAPFARMYQEIWSYLDSAQARQANETLRIRVAPGAAPVGLERFREFAIEATTVLRNRSVVTWPIDALIAVAASVVGAGLKQRRYWPRYAGGQPYRLLELAVDASVSEYARLLHRVHGLLQDAIDDAALRTTSEARTRRLPELDPVESDSNLGHRLGQIADLVPLWAPLFDCGTEAPPEVQESVVSFFAQHIYPRMAVKQFAQSIHQQLNCLALPFWRYRWRTYEIWVAVETLRALAELAPTPIVRNGIIPLDLSTPANIATLRCAGRTSACVVAQLETKFENRRRKRRAIRPDLSICFDDRRKATSRAFVVEAKQRANLSASHLTRVGADYRDGSPNVSGVLILNYDDDVPSLPQLDRVRVVGGVRPGGSGAADMRNEVRRLAAAAGLRAPLPQAVLLDVSASMEELYKGEQVRSALRTLLAMEHVRVARFNDRLLAGGDVAPDGETAITTRGGTDLATSFDQLLAELGPVDTLLVVSDGQYDDAPQVKTIRFRKRILPSQLDRALTWILKPTTTRVATDPAVGVKRR